MRLFIAINFDDEIRGDLAAVADELRRRSIKGTFTLPENLHLTLAFLGDCSPQQCHAAHMVLDQLIFDSFDMRIEGIDRFKNRSGDIWWTGVRKNDELTNLQKTLLRELEYAGFELEKRKFRPHITLGRQIELKSHVPNGGLMGISVPQSVRSIQLMQSERIAERLTYTPLHICLARE